MEKENKGYKLETWAEIIGFLKGFSFGDEEPVLDFSIDLSVVLPCYNDFDVLKKYVGKKIGILRTDNKFEPYRFRLIKNKEKAPPSLKLFFSYHQGQIFTRSGLKEELLGDFLE